MDKEAVRQGAKIAVEECLAIKPSDKVLVVTDDKLFDIGEVLYTEAQRVANEAFFLVMKPRKTHAEEPPKPIADFMLGFDAILIPTYRSMSHTDARRAASAAGVRIATLPNIIPETLARALNADYKAIARRSVMFADMLTKAKEARLTTPAGTDITLSLEGRAGHADTGLVWNPGDFSNLPAGEAYMAPIEGTTQGVMVIDGGIGDTGVLSKDDYITVTIENGLAVAIEGQKAAEYLRSIIEPHGNPARNIAELGIGTNDKAEICGNILEDEKVMGTCHIALGDNKSMGGRVGAPVHYDAILMHPTLYLDGDVVIRDGRHLIAPK